MEHPFVKSSTLRTCPALQLLKPAHMRTDPECTWPPQFSTWPLITLICSTHLLILFQLFAAGHHPLPGGWGTEHATPRPLPSCRLVTRCLSSSLCPFFWNLHQSSRRRGRGRNARTKHQIIKLWNSFASIWAFRFHASHLLRAGKLIQFAPFASHLIQQPLSAVKHASSGRRFYFFSPPTLTTDASSYEISFINLTRRMKAM